MIRSPTMAARTSRPTLSKYSRETRAALRAGEEAARAAGALMLKNLSAMKTVHSAVQHDIKLELDVLCQRLIEKRLHIALPQAAFLGEEESSGSADAELRWVVDPIDGTVNFAYGIPHACVSIALQARLTPNADPAPDHVTIAGLIYDPFCDEFWTASRGGPARLNGRIIRVSTRRRLDEAVIAMGFSKGETALRRMLPVFQSLLPKVRKMRMMGAAALDLAYVASGRMDAYLEGGVRIWDIAAGALLVECAGGECWREKTGDEHAYRILASNGELRPAIQKAVTPHWP